MPEGRGARPGECHRPGLEQRLRLDPGLHGHHDRQVAAGAGRLRTCAAMMTGGRSHYHRRHADVAMSALRDTPGRDGHGAGSAIAPAPPARSVGTSVGPSRPSSASAGSIVQRRPLRGDEIRACWEAADAEATSRRRPASRGVRPTPATSSRIERPFGGSSSSRSRSAAPPAAPAATARRAATDRSRGGPPE